MTVLIIHGIEGYAGIHWQQWLHDQLKNKDFSVIMPNLPNSNHPDRSIWLQTIKDKLKKVDLSQLIIVGHSLGVVTGLDFIQGLKSPIKAFISVSGFHQDYGEELNSYFLKKRPIDLQKEKNNCHRFFVLYGDNDPYVPQQILKSLADDLNVVPKIFPKGDHLNTSAGYTQFPELLKIITSIK